MMPRSDCQPMPPAGADPASTLRLLGLGPSTAGHLGLCRGVAMHAGLSRRYYAEGRPPQGLPVGWTPWCNPGFLVRALQELLGEVHDREVHALCEHFIAQAQALDSVNNVLATGPAECGQLLARLQGIEEETERLWRRLQMRLAQLAEESRRPRA